MPGSGQARETAVEMDLMALGLGKKKPAAETLTSTTRVQLTRSGQNACLRLELVPRDSEAVLLRLK